MANITDQIKRGKIGLIAGAIIGGFVGKFFIGAQELQSIFSTQSIIDTSLGVIQASTKSVIFFVVLGAVIGLTLDLNWDKIRRLLG